MTISTSGLRLATCVLLFCFPGVGAASGADVSGSAKTELVWSLDENEISTPHFSNDGNFIVLVTRVHWPDGHEAEDLPEDYSEKLETRKQQDPRFADPVIRLVDLEGNQVCEVRYGSSPTLSSDDKTIAFSRQKRPLTGLRSLAETMEGNDIQAFDCGQKQTRTIARPDKGYLDNPSFFLNDNSIVYTTNEATNGAFGGPVGLEQVDLSTGVKTILSAKETAPAVPCPKQPSKSPMEAFLCAHARPSPEFPNLILGLVRTSNELVVLLGKPVPSPGDSYMTQKYDLSLVSVSSGAKREILSLGRVTVGELRDFSIQESSSEKVLVRSKYWQVFSAENRNWLPEKIQKNTDRTSVYSPSLDYYLTAEPAEEPDHFTLRQSSDGRVLFSSPKMAAVYEAAWSRDSKRFLVVGVPRRAEGRSYHEQLTVYSIH